LIEQAGFEIGRLEKSYIKDAPKFAGFLYRGVASVSWDKIRACRQKGHQ